MKRRILSTLYTCVVTSVVSCLIVTACGQRDQLAGLTRGEDPRNDPGSGTNPWNEGHRSDGAQGSDVDLSCASDVDCLAGEICLDDVCQMQRCTTYGTSAAPLGSGYTFFWDHELVVSDDSSWLNGYGPDLVPMPKNLIGGAYWSIGSAPILDVVGGNLLEGAPDEMAVSEVDRTVLTVIDGQDTIVYELGFVPVALAAADIDQDGLDELIAAGEDGGLAFCDVAANQCDLFVLQDVSVRDATAGDVDGDGYAELVMLLDLGGGLFFYVLNEDHASTGQRQVITTQAPETLIRIAAGDLDGDGRDEILGLEDNIQIGYTTNALVVFQLVGATMPSTASASVAWDTTDIAVGNFGGQTADDHGDSVAVVRRAGYVDVFDHDSDNPLTFRFSAQLANIGTPARVAFVDYDGDTPRGKLVKGPTPVPGKVVPVMMMQLPPYDREHSLGTSSVSVGDGTSASQGWENSVSYSMGISIGVGADLFNVFSGSVARSMERTMSRQHNVAHTVSVGSNFSMNADPSRFGVSMASVVLASGCYQNFIYDIDDPTGKLVPRERRDADGRALFSVLVPVGGNSALWAVDRYNAMAKAVGNLPIIPTNQFRSGELGSYPADPMRSDGTPLCDEELVFPQPPSFTVSDVGSTSWAVSVTDTEVNGVSQSVSVRTGIDEGLLGFTYGESAGGTWAQSHSLTVGETASFGGTVPPIPNKLGTPSDEYLLFRYSFRPYVYLQRYTDAQGHDAGYYVITYTVGE